MLETVKFWCHKILPMVYDDSLSYYEVLCKLTNKVNELVNSDNELRIALDKIATEYNTNIENIIHRTFDDMIATGEFDIVIDKVVSKNLVNNNVSNLIVKGANYAPWKMFEIFKTYLDNKDRFFYGTPSFIGYDYDEITGVFTPQLVNGRYSETEDGVSQWGYVCSTLVNLVLMGVPFETCRINTGLIQNKVVNGVNVPVLVGGENKPLSGLQSINLKAKEIKDYWGFSGHGTIYSANIAKLFNDIGMLHKINTDDYSELMPGDILFYDNYTGGQSTIPFLNINHCDVFIGWSGNNIICLNSDTDVDTGNNEDNRIGYSKWNISQANSFARKYLKYYVRIPQPGNPQVVRRITGDISALTGVTFSMSNNPTVIIPAIESLESNRAYTAVIKLKPGYTGNNLRVNIFGAKDQNTITQGYAQMLVQKNHAQRCGVHEYYCVYIVPEGNPDGLNGFRVSFGADGNFSLEVEDFAVYNKIICPEI